MAQVVYSFWGKKERHFLLQLKAISYSATKSAQISRRHWSPLILGLNTHISSANIISGVGNLRPGGHIRPTKQNYPVRSPFTDCSNCMDRLVVLYFINLPSLHPLVLHAYYELLMRKGSVL